MSTPDLPLISVTLTLHQSLSEAQGGVSLERLRGCAQAVIDALNIPAQAAVSLQIADEAEKAPLHLSLEGKNLPCNGEIIARAIGYAEGVPPRGFLSRAAALYQLERLWQDDRPAFEQALGLILEEALKGKARLLLTDLTLDRLVAGHDLPFAPAHIREAFEGALDLRIGLGEALTSLKRIAAEDPESHQQPLRLGEGLIALLAAPTVEVHFHPDYLRSFTLSPDESITAYFLDARTNFETFGGAILPPFEFCADPKLKPQALAFKINDLLTLPLIGLLPTEGLANEEPQNLINLGIAARPAANPQIFTRNAIVAWADEAHWGSYGVYMWNSNAYVFLAAAGTVRDYAPCFVTTERLEAILSAWQPTYPALIALSRARLKLDRISAAARTLAHEGFPIRDLRLLLDLMLAAPPGADLIAHLRRGLRDSLATDLTAGHMNLNVYEVGPDLLPLLEGEITPAAAQTILETFDDFLESYPGAFLYPAVVVPEKHQRALAELLRGAFPRLVVVSGAELSPYLRLTPHTA